jgi:hypothetical protein
MAGLSDIVSSIRGFGGSSGISSDDLIRQAQTGDLNAYKELMRRGEIVPPPGDPAGRFGRHGRPAGGAVDSGGEGLGLSYMSAINNHDSGPAYLTGEGGAPQPGGGPIGLPDYMASINPQQQEAPDYLGQGMMQPPPSAGQSKIAALAGGNDAAGSIQRGAAAADDVTGEMDHEAAANELPEPIKALSAAFANSDDSDPYEQQTADTIKELLSGINPEKNKNMALAQAGFAMAASGSPYFLQGVGVGGEAGLKAYNEAQDRDTAARVRAAQLGTDLSQSREAKRAHKATETIDVARVGETARSNVAQEGLEGQRNTETQRANRATEGIQRSQLGVSQQNASIAAGHLQVAQDSFNFTKQQYQEGKATEDELKKAQVDLVKAQTAAQDAMNLDRTTDVQIGQDGTVYNIDKATNKAQPILGPDNKPIKAQPKNASATALKVSIWQAAGKSAQEISDILAGKRPPTEREKIDAATRYAQAKSATYMDVTQQTAAFNQSYNEAIDAMSAPAEGAPQGGAAQETAPPAAKGSDTPPVEGAKKAPNGNWYVPDPKRPGKYLQVQ